MQHPEVFQEALQFAAELWIQHSRWWSKDDKSISVFADQLVLLSMAAASKQEQVKQTPNIIHDVDGTPTYLLSQAQAAAGNDLLSFPIKSWTKITCEKDCVEVHYIFGIHDMIHKKVFYFPTPERRLAVLGSSICERIDAECASESRRIDKIFVIRSMRIQASQDHDDRMRYVSDEFLLRWFNSIAAVEHQY